MSDVTNYNRTLTWSNFPEKSQRPSAANENAQISTQAALTSLRTNNSGGVYTISDVTVAVTMNRLESWVVSDQKSDALLEHEQGHYDIQAIAAWDIMSGLLNLSANSMSDLATKKNNFISAIQSKLVAVTDRYESRTGNGAFSGAQTTWTNTIAEVKRTDGMTLDNLPS